jgi:hypothetical protein
MRRIVVAVVVTALLSLTAEAQAANGPTSGNEANVTKATLASFFFSGTTLYPATCQETQVINSNQRKETFECSFDAAVPERTVCDTSTGCVWFSDFDGAEATSTHFVVTASGRMVGWATF